VRLLASFFVSLAASLAFWPAKPAAADKAPAPAAFGIDKRVPWTTSKVKGSPDPPLPYHSEVAFPKLKFFEPLDITGVPGTNRLAVAEHKGKVFSFVNDPSTDRADLLLDLKKSVFGIAFHPQFAMNGYLYVNYVPDTKKRDPKGCKVARFTVTRDERPRCDPASEKIIFEWPSGGHSGGSLQFGPDGYLYIGTGDGSTLGDELQNGQSIASLQGKVLRIDVDSQGKPEGANPRANYRIPKDNPFVNTPGARPEIWAYGIRQPWKMSFDRSTGHLWVGEVGQDLWESVLRIERGGNYGWSINEGTHPFRPDRTKGPTPILLPVVEHPHSEFCCLIGGFVYRGAALKELAGAYIYGDFDTGAIWGLRYDGQRVTWQRELAGTTVRIVGFAEDRAGELYHLDYVGGTIHRLEPAPPAPVAAQEFPRKLSETGLFASTKDHVPAPGVIPYSVNAPLWSDHAFKERFLALPGNSQIEFDAIDYPQPAPGAPRGWRFPDGTVIAKTFSLEMEKGNPASRRRLETRLLHFHQLAGTQKVTDQLWRGYTYIWNEEQTDAVLLEGRGLDHTFTIRDSMAPGGQRQQTWHFPSRSECVLCHTRPAKYVLGVNTLQMNKDHDYGGVIANQLSTLEHLGIFTKPLPESPARLPKLHNYAEEALPIDQRARSYLHANCAHCHMKWGGGNADFQLLATLDLKDTGTIDALPTHGTFDIANARLLAPGAPERSLIFQRMTKLGLGRMPHVGSLVVDDKGVQLIRDWIKGLPDQAKAD
jgi:uncharacterized repeat protein (TIGR03806 family)